MLYEVGYDRKVFHRITDYDKGEAPVSTWSRGIKVTLWVEKGVLFAFTEEPGIQGELRRNHISSPVDTIIRNTAL